MRDRLPWCYAASVALGAWRPHDVTVRRVIVGVCVAVGLVAVAVWSQARIGRDLQRIAVVMSIAVGFAFAGSVLMNRAEAGLVRHPLVEAVETRAAVEAWVVLVNDPKPRRFDTTAIARVTVARVRGEAPFTVDRIVELRARGRTRGTLAALQAADSLHVTGDMAPLDRYEQHLRWRHAVARLDVYRIESVHEPTSAWWRVANGARGVIQRGIDVLDADDRALLSGVLLGDTRAIDPVTADEFRRSGVSHLPAVSGANVAFVLSLFGPLLRRLPILTRSLVAIGVVGVFATMTRFEPSVVRAAAMAVIVMLSQAVGRPAAGARVLAYAVIAAVCVDPFLVHSVGFGLSVSACAGISSWQRPVASRLPGPRWFREVLAASIAAQLGVLPLLWGVFGTVAWIAPAANLFAVPLAEPLTVLGIPAAVMAGSVPAVRVVMVPLAWLVATLRAVAHIGATQPIAVAGAAILVVVFSAITCPRPTVDSQHAPTGHLHQG